MWCSFVLCLPSKRQLFRQKTRTVKLRAVVCAFLYNHAFTATACWHGIIRKNTDLSQSELHADHHNNEHLQGISLCASAFVRPFYATRMLTWHQIKKNTYFDQSESFNITINTYSPDPQCPYPTLIHHFVFCNRFKKTDLLHLQ